MILRAKIAAVALRPVGGLLMERPVIRQHGIEMTRDTMRGTILGAENTRQSISAMSYAKSCLGNGRILRRYDTTCVEILTRC